MRALVIAPQPFFTPRGTPFSVYYRTLVMAEMGVEMDLLTYGEGEDVDIPGVRILRIPKIPFTKPTRVGPSGKKLFLDLFLVLRTLALLLRRRYDFVHAHEEAVFFCRFLKPIFRFRLIYDMHSSLPQQLTNFKFTRSKLLINTFAWLEDSCLAKSDAVVTICPELADYAIPRVADARRHFLIENSLFEDVRLRRNGTTPAAPAPPELPDDRPIVAYGGTLEPYQGIDLLIAAFAKARERRRDAFLLLVGGSPEQVEDYRRLAADLALRDHCLFTGRLDQVEARRLLQKAAVLTSPRSSGTNTPLKIYELLASGKPIVATRILSHTQVLTDDVAFLAEPEVEAYAEALVAALTDAPARERIVSNARELYEKEYSRPAYEDKIRRLLEVIR